MSLADTLVALGAAFLVAGVLARLGRTIELPTIPLFMVGGVLLGPNTPGIELFENPVDLDLLAALGLVFLLLYIGLEFHVEELTAGGRGLLAAGCTYIAVNVGCGLAFGLALGWGLPEALVIAGVLGISSSAIVSKILIELGRLRNPESPLILGIIVIEDVFLALYLALLAPVLGGADGALDAALSIAVAFGVLAGLAAVARFGGRLVTKAFDTGEDELLIVTVIGAVLLVAGLAEELGVKYAIAALMMGIVFASTPLRDRIVGFTHPLRDAFGALFFFAFGLTIDPGDVLSVAVPLVIAVVLTVVLNLTSGVLAARFTGVGRQEGTNVGLTLLARGEFALVLAALGVAAGLDDRIAPFAAGYVLVLAVLGPLAATRSGLVAALLPERLFPASSAQDAPAPRAPGAD